MSWQPSASLSAIEQRARLYQQIRAFFLERQVLEVDVPVLSAFGTVDPFIDSLQTSVLGSTRYLQTSPEFFLKRFLAAQQQDCYYLGKAFRQGESGRHHHPEFTMLEWYRVGWDEQQLVDEVKLLLQQFLPQTSYTSISYAEAFERHTGLNPHVSTAEELKVYAFAQIETSLSADDRDTWLGLLWTHCVEPQLKGLCCVYDYPASQAALARVDIDQNGYPIARRFEFYFEGLELANGYWELADAKEQLQRFQEHDSYRRKNNLPKVPYDQALVAALAEGDFPECAGVALGIDRLLMCAYGYEDIKYVISFDS